MTTSIRVRAAVAIAAATVLGSASAFLSPAHAADTTTTFTLTGGSLSISAPASKALGSAVTGSSATASTALGTVSVDDPRGALLGTWTASVSSTDFTTGTATANETIAKANADYWSGAATVSTGTAVRVPGQLLVANKVTLASSRTAFSATGVVGNGVTSWVPTVSVNIPAASVAGDYTGTITHSVA